MLVNLISNAIKYTFKGSVKLIVSRYYDERHKNDVIIKFAVEDTGLGIKEEDLKTIFDMFTMTDNYKITKQRGSGLGLYMCNKIS